MLLIFDCDGTLVDSEALNNNAFSEILTESGIEGFTTKKCLETFLGFSLENCLKKVRKMRPNAEFDDQDMINKYIERTLKNMDRDLKIDPNTVPVLEHFKSKGIEMIVASNGEKVVVEETIKAAGLDHIFPKDKIFTKNMVANPKPAADLFLFAQRKAGCKNDYTVVLEDSVTGVKAGKAASMRVIGITAFSENAAEQAKSLQKAGADFIIADITGLEAMITPKTTLERQLRTDFTKQA